MKQLILLLALLNLHCSVGYLNAQTPETDSLENLIKTHRKADTNRVNLLNITALKFYLVDNDKHLGYAEQALELAEKLRYEKGRAEGLRLKGLYYYNTSDNQQALAYFQRSFDIYDRIGDKKGLSLSLNYLGMANWKLGNISQAMEYIKESYAVAEELGDKALIATCLKSFGILYLVQGDYSQSVEYFQKAITLNEELGDIRGLTDCLNNIGFIHMRQGNNDQALEYFHRNVEILEENGDRQGASSSYINIGIIHQHQGNYPEAVNQYNKALALFEEFDDKEGISKCLNNIGLIYQSQGNYTMALEYIQNSLKIKEQTGDIRDAASCRMNIGGIHENQNNPAKALEYFQSSLSIFEELGDKQGISNCLIRIGNAYRLQGNHSEALDYFNDGLNLKEELGDKYGISNCLQSMGNIFALQGEYKQALTYYQSSRELKEEIEDKSGMCLLFNAIGKVYFQTKNYHSALEYTLESLELARELSLLDAQKDIHKQLSDIYYSLGSHRNAYENHLLYKELYDSIYNVQEITRLAGLELQYMYEKEKQAIELEQLKKDAIRAEEEKRQKVFRNSLIIGFALTAILLFVILISFLGKRKANRILAEQKREIENQNAKITDSIQYAERIQKALFPPEELMDELLPEHFIFNKPRDIVSGDFFWVSERDGKVVVAVADCTGHGVPGAFMSLLGISFLNDIVNKVSVLKAHEILFHLREHVIRSLRQQGRKDEARDGMDISLCIFDFKRRRMQFAGAFSQVFLIRNSELIVLKGDKMPIGISVRKDQLFTNKEMELEQNDNIYLFTDGFVDQIGGPKRKTFRTKYLKELLLKIHEKSMREQKSILQTTYDDWKGEIEQIDDILMMGIRI